MWCSENDFSKPVLTPQAHMSSSHSFSLKSLPKTAILFYMHSGVELTAKNYKTYMISQKFPRFLNSCPIYGFDNRDICFLDGGRGAPQAVDTIETLAALGVKNVISVGMMGAFGAEIQCGDVIIPQRAYVEEGTSLHYYESIEYSCPSAFLLTEALNRISNNGSFPIVTTDAVYRQTFEKEAIWRDKGCVGVDMETSALFSVGKYLDLNVISVLIASDKHPMNETDKKWSWRMTANMREDYIRQCVDFVLDIFG